MTPGWAGQVLGRRQVPVHHDDPGASRRDLGCAAACCVRPKYSARALASVTVVPVVVNGSRGSRWFPRRLAADRVRVAPRRPRGWPCHVNTHPRACAHATPAGLAVSRTGEYVVTGGHDKSIRFWQKSDEQARTRASRALHAWSGRGTHVAGGVASLATGTGPDRPGLTRVSECSEYRCGYPVRSGPAPMKGAGPAPCML